MIRTQVQLPDDLYRAARRLAEQREWSLAEVIRRGLESLLQVYPVKHTSAIPWALPAPVKLGWRSFPADNLRLLANETTGEFTMSGGAAPGTTPPPDAPSTMPVWR
ncbi:MAG: ribbon-helix-helix domain-containing protein [Kiritimatiellaeota bacterium]|nr:ribbon-helix-helix domain-containing protein [Kiritimatiellota bacterium]